MTEIPSMPLYQCHKQVRAVKITDITRNEGGNYELSFDGYPSGIAMAAWMEKHSPEIGGYFVVYEDGYESYLPAETFESGYTPIDQVREGDKKETAQKVSIDEQIEANIASEHYFTAADGAKHAEQGGMHDFGREPKVLGLLTFCVLVLHNGDTVVGKSTCTFNAELGREIARKDAINQLWPLMMGYELRTNLAGL